jgi:L-aminoadipate-semialdehyde dehydrogenase
VQTDRFALLSGLAYNHLHRDIFTALYLARRFTSSNHRRQDSEQLTEWLQQNEITILHLTPACGQLLSISDERRRFHPFAGCCSVAMY